MSEQLVDSQHPHDLKNGNILLDLRTSKQYPPQFLQNKTRGTVPFVATPLKGRFVEFSQ